MIPARLLCQLKEDAGQSLSKVLSVIKNDDSRNSDHADILGLLSALSELSMKAKSSIVLEQVADILSTLATCRRINEQELKVWLAAATNVVTKDATQSASIAKLLDAAPLFLSYKEEELAPVMVSWCRLVLHVLLSDDESLRTMAGSVLQSHRESILGRRKLAAHAHTAVRNYLVAPLRKWFDCNKGTAALNIWSTVVGWLGETLRKSQAACVNALLTVAEKGFRSCSTEIQCLTLETWKVLIDNVAINPEMLKLSRSLKLLMTPLKSSLSHKVQVQLQCVRTNWYLACRLGEALPDTFEQVCLPLLQNVAMYLSEGRSPGTPEDRMELKRECVYLLARLLEPSNGADISTNGAAPAVDIPLTALRCPLPISILSRQIAAFEKAASAAFAWSHEHRDIEDVTLLIGRWLIRHALEAHSSKNVQVVSSILKLITDAVGKYFPPSASMRIVQEACRMPETLLLSHCYYSGKSGVLHGTPAFSLLELLFQPAIIKAFGSQEEFITQVKQLLAVGMKGSSWLQFAQGAVALLEHTPLEAAPLGSLWLALASPLLSCVQSTQEVNQGNQLEHDFSALVAVLCFPVQHIPAISSLQNKRNIQKKWAELYKAFACCAALVPTAPPNTSCHEFCHRLHAGLTQQLKMDVTYIELVCDVLVTVHEHTNKGVLSRAQSGGASVLLSSFCEKYDKTSPKWSAHARHRNSTPLGNLHWYVLVLAWCLDGCSLAEKKLRDGNAAQPAQTKNVLLGTVQTCLRLAQELFQCMRNSSLLEETLKLLGPSLAPFFAATKGKLASKGFTSSITPKLEALWSALVTSTVTNHLGPRNGSLLPTLAPLLESTLLHPRATINDRAVQLWHTLFAQTSAPLDIPTSLKEVLQQTRPCLLPGFVPEDDIVSSCQATSLSQDDFFVPDAQLPVLPKNERATTIPPPELLGSTIKPTKPRLEEMKDEEFVRIDSPSVKPVVLTEHQKEVLRERRPLPALYNNLSQDAMDSTCCSETQDPMITDTHEQCPEVTMSESEVLQEVIVVDTDDQTNANREEAANGVSEEANEVVSPSQLPEETAQALSSIAHVVLETQDLLPPPPASPLVTSDIQVVLKRIDPSQLANLKVTYPQSPYSDSRSCSPKVHKPKRKLSFAQKSSISFEEVADAAHFDSDDIVPCSQSADQDSKLPTCSALQSGSSASSSILNDDAVVGTDELPKSEEKPSRKRKQQPTNGWGAKKSLRHENSNGAASDYHNVLRSSKPSAQKMDDGTAVVQVTVCEAVSHTMNQSKEYPEHKGVYGAVEKGQESPGELRRGMIAEEGTKSQVGEAMDIKAAKVDDETSSKCCDEQADAMHPGVEDSVPPEPNVELEDKTVKKKRRGRPPKAKNLKNKLRDNKADSDVHNRNGTEQACKESAPPGTRPKELSQLGTGNTAPEGSKSVIYGNEKSDVLGANENDHESGSSQESSCASQNSSSSTQRARRSLRHRKKSPRALAMEESNKLMRCAKLGSPSNFGTKSIKSYFFSIVEEQSKVEDAKWDSLLNVEELQPEDGVSPLPQDNEVSALSGTFIKHTGKTYRKSHTGTDRADKAFDALVAEAKGVEKLSDDVIVTETEQTQPYDFLEVEGNSVDFEDHRDRKDSEACHVVSETEDTQPCKSPELTEIKAFTSEQQTDAAGTETVNQNSTEKKEGKHEQSLNDCLFEATEVSNTKQSCNHTDPFQCTSEALFTSRESHPPAITSEIRDACQEDEVPEDTSIGPLEEIDTAGWGDGIPKTEGCAPDPVGHVECAVNSLIELKEQSENSCKVGETANVLSRLSEAELGEEHKPELNGNTSEQGTAREECLDIEEIDGGLPSILTVSRATPCKESSDHPEDENIDASKGVKFNGNDVALAATEGNIDVVPTVEASYPSLTTVSGAKKRKLPFQRISPIANRLRSRRVRMSLDSSRPFFEEHFIEEGPMMQPKSNNNGVQGAAEPLGRYTSPTRRHSQPGATGASCLSPLSRSQKMLDAAIKRMAELSPSSKARIILDEPAKDGEPRGFVGILKKQALPNPNSDALSPKQNKRHVSFADPIIQGEYQARRLPCRRRRSLDVLYVPRGNDLAEEVITDSQEPLCKELESCTDPVEKVIPLITTGTWASSIRQYFKRQGLDTVGALSALRPPQVRLMPLRAPKVSTLRRGLQAYLASLPSSPAHPVEELAATASLQEENIQVQEPESAEISGEVQPHLATLPSSPARPADKLATTASVQEENTQVQEPQGAQVSGEAQPYLASLLSSPAHPAEELATAAPLQEEDTQVLELQGAQVSGEAQPVSLLPCNGPSGTQDAVVEDGQDTESKAKSSESDNESQKETCVDYNALSNVLDQLTPKVLSMLPYAKVVNLLDNVVQVIKTHVPPEQNTV